MELGRILLYSADELCRYVAARLKYSSACYSSSKLQWSGGILRYLNGMDCYLLFPVVSVQLLMVSEHRWLTLIHEPNMQCGNIASRTNRAECIYGIRTYHIYKVTKKFAKRKQAHVGMKSSKTNQTRRERHHNTFTPSLHLVPFCQNCVFVFVF